MRRTLCVCGLGPRLDTRTRVVVLIHKIELGKPTNTGRLAVRYLANSELVVRGEAPRPEPAAPVPAGYEPLLLLPAADATPLGAWRGTRDPLALLVPDGNWRQAVKMRKRLSGLDTVPCAALPIAPRSGRRLRSDESGPGRLATLEAIARALGVLEGPAIEQALLHVFRVMVERTLWTRGRIPASAVTGGIPDGAL
jgi:DTW domain-containing protein YfiP